MICKIFMEWRLENIRLRIETVELCARELRHLYYDEPALQQSIVVWTFSWKIFLKQFFLQRAVCLKLMVLFDCFVLWERTFNSHAYVLYENINICCLFILLHSFWYQDQKSRSTSACIHTLVYERTYIVFRKTNMASLGAKPIYLSTGHIDWMVTMIWL